MHKPQSPRAIEDLPDSFHCAVSPGAKTAELPAVSNSSSIDIKGKRRATVLDEDDNDDARMSETTPILPQLGMDFDVARPSGASNEEADDAEACTPYRPHHPQNPAVAPSAQNGFGVQGPPGGDCKRICLRHQRMVDGGSRVALQKRLEKLSENEQQMANTIWSLFSSSSGRARIITLQGLLAICCPSQLSFLTEQLKAECRLDPFAVLPRELSLKCMGYLDAITLGRAAQVSKSWKALADDDLLWRTMCEQHIERKCEKCGWGLPLLERKRKQKSPAPGSTAQAQIKYDNAQHNHTPLPKSLEEALSRPFVNPAKRPRLESSAPSSSSLHLDHLNLSSNPPSPSSASTSFQDSNSRSLQITRPWKSVYCERLAIARNWARGNCNFRTLTGHTDAITCLQIDETLNNPAWPVLMTGSWDRTIRIWNAETGNCENVLRGHTRGVRCIQFDSVKLISGSMDCTLKIWSWRTGQCIRTLEGHRDAVISLCFDKHVLASGSADSTIKVWNFNTAECFTLRGHREWVNQVKIWSPDSTDCSPTPTTAEMAADSLQSHDPQQSSSSPPSIKLLFSASDDGTVKVWDLLTRQCVRTLEGHVAQVQCLKVLSIDEHSSTSFPIGTTDKEKNSYIQPSEQRKPTLGRSQVVDGNGYDGFFENMPAASTSAGFVNAADVPHGPPTAATFLQAAARPPPDPSTLPYINFGEGKAPLVISGSLDNTIKMWNVEEATCARTLFGHIEGVWALDMDKLRIVSASHDRTIKIWDRASGRCLHTLVGHRGAVTSVALGDDKIISGSDDSTVRIWSFAQQS